MNDSHTAPSIGTARDGSRRRQPGWTSAPRAGTVGRHTMLGSVGTPSRTYGWPWSQGRPIVGSRRIVATFGAHVAVNGRAFPSGRSERLAAAANADLAWSLPSAGRAAHRLPVRDRRSHAHSEEIFRRGQPDISRTHQPGPAVRDRPGTGAQTSREPSRVLPGSTRSASSPRVDGIP